jgi:hypothetical protein
MIKRPIQLALVAVLLYALLTQNRSLGSLSPNRSLSSSALRSSKIIIMLQEDFAELPLGMNWLDGSAHGQWRDRWNGGGKVGIELDGGSQVLGEMPMAPRWPSDTHSALVTSRKTLGDTDMTVHVKTVKQLRYRPNTWEMGWVVWHYVDNLHFYYFMLKTNGWELGKEDPHYKGNMRTMVKRYSPVFKVGQWYTVRVLMVGRWITVWVNGTQLAKYKDWQWPYYGGRLGLYCEDSHAEYSDILVTQA